MLQWFIRLVKISQCKRKKKQKIFFKFLKANLGSTVKLIQINSNQLCLSHNLASVLLTSFSSIETKGEKIVETSKKLNECDMK